MRFPIHVRLACTLEGMPPESGQVLATPAPVQLTFDHLVATPGNHFALATARLVARPGPPRFNPVTIRGIQGAGKSRLLEVIGAERRRLAPGATVLCVKGAELARTSQGELEAADLLLLDDLERVDAAIARLLTVRVDARRLTVVALAPGQLRGLRRFADASTHGISVEMLPPCADTRREIVVRYLHEHGVSLDGAASAALATIPWYSVVDVETLARRLAHVAYSHGSALSASGVRALTETLGRCGLDAAGGWPGPCCAYRLRCVLPAGRWPEDDEPLPAPGQVRTEAFRHCCRSVELRIRRWQDRLRLEMRADHEGRVPARFELDVRLRPRLSLRVREKGDWRSVQWGLTAGIARPGKDPFQAANRWVYRALVPRMPRGEDEPPYAVPAELRETSTSSYQVIRELAVAAASMLDPAARKVALRFPAHMRAWLYRQLTGDASGRLAQLASTCPGALTFAYALAKLGHRAGTVRASARLLRGVIAGRGLNDVLDEALAAWADGTVRIVQSPRTGERRRTTWERVSGASESARRDVLRQQRLLVRRAGAGVPSHTLWLPPPLHFAPEDIPTKKHANAAWFRVMKCHGVTMRPACCDSPDRVPNICAFLSRNAVALTRNRGTRSYHWALQELFDFASAMDDYPRRTTSAERYLAASARWHQNFAQAQDLAVAAAMVRGPLYDPEGNPWKLPEPPCPGWRDGEDIILPLRTAEQIVAEGARMHNCVASRIPDVVAGRSALYHGEVAGRPLTIEIARSLGGYRLAEAKAYSNEEPAIEQRRALGEFVRHFDSAQKCACGHGDATAGQGKPERASARGREGR